MSSPDTDRMKATRHNCVKCGQFFWSYEHELETALCIGCFCEEYADEDNEYGGLPDTFESVGFIVANRDPREVEW